MDKTTAIDLLGGSVTKAAKEIGITASAVSQWPDRLPKSAMDKVQAALWRKSQAVRRASDEADTQSGSDGYGHQANE